MTHGIRSGHSLLCRWNSPTWNGATIVLPVRITSDYTHHAFDGTSFFVTPSNETGGEQKGRRLTITLPTGRSSHGRMLIYTRRPLLRGSDGEDDSCEPRKRGVEVLIRSLEALGFPQFRRNAVRLEAGESITIHNIDGEYYVLSRSGNGGYGSHGSHGGYTEERAVTESRDDERLPLKTGGKKGQLYPIRLDKK